MLSMLFDGVRKMTMIMLLVKSLPFTPTIVPKLPTAKPNDSTLLPILFSITVLVTDLAGQVSRPTNSSVPLYCSSCQRL
jgi:hypothetical protein